MLEHRVKVNQKAAQHLNGRWTVFQVVQSRDYKSSFLDLIKVQEPVASDNARRACIGLR